jgi:hypothetical protein
MPLKNQILSPVAQVWTKAIREIRDNLVRAMKNSATHG